MDNDFVKSLAKGNLATIEEFIPSKEKLFSNEENFNPYRAIFDLKNKLKSMIYDDSDLSESELYNGMPDMDKILSFVDTKSLVKVFDEIANLYKQIRENDSALEWSYLSLFVKKDKKFDKSEILESLTKISDYYFNKGSFDLALEYCQDGITLYEEINDQSKSKILIDLLDKVAYINYANGNFATSLANYEKILSIKEKGANYTKEDLISNYNSIGNIYYSREEFDWARSYYDKSLEIDQSISNKSSINHGIILNNIGNIYYRMEEFDDAITNYNKSLRIKNQNNPNSVFEANSMSNMANISNDLDDFATAENLYKKAVKLYNSNKSSNFIDYSKIKNNLGVLYHNFSNLTLSLAFYNDAEKILSDKNTDPLNHALYLKNIANYHWSINDYDIAKSYYERAIDMEYNKIPKSLRYTNSVSNFCLLLKENGEQDDVRYKKYFSHNLNTLSSISFSNPREFNDLPKATVKNTSKFTILNNEKNNDLGPFLV